MTLTIKINTFYVSLSEGEFKYKVKSPISLSNALRNNHWALFKNFAVKNCLVYLPLSPCIL